MIGVEPTEGIALEFNTKVPGPTIAATQVHEVHATRIFREPATGYETLIHDCMIGDNILFERADSVEAGWESGAAVLRRLGGGLRVPCTSTRPDRMARR